MQFVDIDWATRRVCIEYQWLGVADAAAPLLVFLHEGLGSVSMWREFPARLCAALACRGLVYSRPGYGRSTPRAADEAWAPDFMHRQAHELLPALLAALAVDVQAQPPWLFGHSDGGSIALLHAARWPDRVAGTVVLAPHILVEPLSLDSIAQAREAYRHGGLRGRLARHHAQPDSAFWGWNDIWLHPAFRDWAIGDALRGIRGPLLAIQGRDDEYGTLAQIHGIAERCPQTQLLELPACGHSPHRDQPQAVIDAVQAWMAPHRAAKV
ncbi:alpha/beta fold hydrolase [Aquabacterium sp. OR-4]|uniref:alpha/beta fold hydrolase n=1 Tax=Aquabacterium sp. OR-4 TaxID=2978127 RepID=UPI0021B2B23E|nr:alpha/beta hydrolase [Aquabacterium sp. OR-4]MDT7834142.1 alpha/beta hydrolase [Aquabacterium sp. OR-4]